ncbi:DUF5345 family protein [Paenibacillus kobensis]|uniref:DUF5345 family protein n=1 Tax=Paenibacillus kobensis TaxID=59841 RepID=UPI000FDA79BD|nr:DUF5345 family protein [Paenibacillus kobensis]
MRDEQPSKIKNGRQGRHLASDEHKPAGLYIEAQQHPQLDDDAWFKAELGSALRQLDDLSDDYKETPSLNSLRTLVVEHRAHSKQKLWKGLAMLWGIGIAGSGLMLAAWLYDARLLLAAQAGILVCALLFAAFIAMKREGGRWTK